MRISKRIRSGIPAVMCVLALSGSPATAVGAGATRHQAIGNCAGPARDASLLLGQQQIMAKLGHLTTLRDWADVAELVGVGWPLPTHLLVTFENLGVAIARPEALMETQVEAGNPGMIVYAPTEPSPADANPYTAHFPYVLIGWAYGIQYTPGQIPTSPDLCVRKEDWFVHEQGVHTFPDWGFVSEPPPERYRGEVPGDMFPAPTRAFGPTHGRFWDMHLWLNPKGGVPLTGIDRPGAYIPGVPMPRDAFFFPESPPTPHSTH